MVRSDDKMCMTLCCVALMLLVLAFTVESWASRCDGEVDCDPAVSTKDMRLAASIIFSLAAVAMFVACLKAMDMDVMSMIPFLK